MGRQASECNDNENHHIPVAVIVTSSNDLEPLHLVLENIQKDIRCALIVVTPNRDTLHPQLIDLLPAVTNLPVRQAAHQKSLTAGTIYILPWNHHATLNEGHFDITATDGQADHEVLSVLLRSMCHAEPDNTAVVFLPGTSRQPWPDLKMWQQAGGHLIVEARALSSQAQPPSIEPDISLPAGKIASHLHKLFQRPDGLDHQITELSSELGQITWQVQRLRGLDFSRYKPATISRRTARRMAALNISDVRAYLALLAEQPREVDRLIKSLLVSVTGFFRDPAAWSSLRHQLELWLRSHTDQQSLRLWIAGCATGEEAYSLAILLCELLGDDIHHFPLDITATDIDEEALDVARRGYYPPSALAALNQKQQQHYFEVGEDGATVLPWLREMVNFASHNLVGDPPLTAVDVITCRNLLIYFNTGLQRQILQQFRHSLNPAGILMLGRAESISADSGLLTVDQRNRLFTAPPSTTPPSSPPIIPGGPSQTSIKPFVATEHPWLEVLQQACDFLVVLNHHHRIRYCHGSAEPFFHSSVPPVDGGLVFSHLHPQLEPDLRVTLRRRSAKKQHCHQQTIETRHGLSEVRLVVTPLQTDPTAPLWVISFQQQPLESLTTEPAETNDSTHGLSTDELQLDLAATKAYLREIIESHRQSDEQMHALHEELQSSNEELQASHDELQSMNEELETSNRELEETTCELEQTQDRLHRIMQASPAIIYTASADDPLNMTFVSTNCEAITGYLPATLAENPHFFQQIMLQSDMQYLQETTQQWLADGARNTCTMTYRYRHADGQWRWMNNRIVATRDRNDQPLELVGSAYDITDTIESQHRLESLASNIRGILYQLQRHSDGTITIPYASEGTKEVHGCTAQEAMDDAWAALGNIHPDDIDTVLADIERSAQTMEPWDFFYRVNLPHASTIWVHAYMTPVAQPDDSVLWHGYVTDITDRKLVEEQLRSSEERFRDVLDSLEMIAYVADMSNHEVLFINKYTRELVGDVEGQPCWKVLQNQPRPCEFCTNHRLLDKWGKPAGTVVWEHYNPISRQWYECRDQAIVWHNGKLVRFEIAVNITDRKNLQKNLEQQVAQEQEGRQESEQQLKTIFANSPLGITILEGDVFVSCNAAAANDLGYNQGELIGKTPLDISPQRQLDGTLSSIASASIISRVLSGITEEFEWILCHRNGQHLTMNVRLTPIELQNRRMIFGLWQDVTEQKQLKRDRELDRAVLIQQAKMAEMGSMIGAIAHQWKQPLNNVALLAQSLIDLQENDELDSAALGEEVELIMNNLDFMSKTVDDFSDFFRPSKEREKFRVGQATRPVLNMLQGALQRHGIELDFISKEDYWVDGYASEFKHVVLNIINNARDALQEKQVVRPHIEVTLTATAESVSLCFEDNAGGIPKELLPDKLFEPFFTTKDRDGMGIGLPLSRQIITKVAGRLEASNTPHGAKFCIVLPRISSHSS
ncbi:CheR family methyltransferase [Desulfurispira natronophila]|nr:CheR family methyltransferase [Desulfurispira natronophila]